MCLKRMTKWIVGSFLVLLAGGGVLLLLLDHALSGICDNERLAGFVSPRGEHQAVVFRRNCGATTPYSVHVSVLPAGRELPNEAGNILIIRDYDLTPRLHWKEPARLLVEYPVYIDASHVDEALGGVSVEYAVLREE